MKAEMSPALVTELRELEAWEREMFAPENGGVGMNNRILDKLHRMRDLQLLEARMELAGRDAKWAKTVPPCDHQDDDGVSCGKPSTRETAHIYRCDEHDADGTDDTAWADLVRTAGQR